MLNLDHGQQITKQQAEALLTDFARYANSDGDTVIYKSQVDRYLALLDEPIDLKRPRGYSQRYKESFA